MLGGTQVPSDTWRLITESLISPMACYIRKEQSEPSKTQTPLLCEVGHQVLVWYGETHICVDSWWGAR